MDNQQLNPKQGRVQRSSRKRVLDLKQFIIWETPCIKNKIYIYTLSSSKDNIIRYIGITNEPLRRLSHHTSKFYKTNTHKYNWIKKVLSENLETKEIILHNSVCECASYLETNRQNLRRAIKAQRPCKKHKVYFERRISSQDSKAISQE